MTTVDRNWLLLALTIVALIGVSAAFAPSVDGEVAGLMIPVVLLIEVVVYFIAAMVLNPKATIPMAFGSAMFLMVLRTVSAFTGAIIYGTASGQSSTDLAIHTWIAPLAVIIQVAMLVLAGPYVIAIVLPDLVGREMSDTLLGNKTPAKPLSAGRPGLETSPTGGFIQVFSFEELGGVVKKIHGIEGFLLINNEGLVVWKDFPMRVNTDVLAARFHAQTQLMSTFVEGTGMTKVRRVMVEAREHFLFCTTLDQNFSLLLIFNGRVAPEEIMSRIAIMAKTCREFLQWKYPSLPLRADGMRELEMVHSSETNRG